MNRKISIYLLIIIFFLFSFSLMYGYNTESCLNDDSSGSCTVDFNNSIIGVDTLPNITTADVNSNFTDNKICSVYFSGIGCPHCAKADPYLLNEYIRNNNLVVIEYEVYNDRENAHYMLDYDDKYKSGLHIPLFILNKNNIFLGDDPIINNVPKALKNLNKNHCPLPTTIYENGNTSFEKLNFNLLAGSPKIWKGSRVLVKTGYSNLDNSFLHNLLDTNDISCLLEDVNFSVLNNTSVQVSGTSIDFDNGIQLNGWKFYWVGKSVIPNCSSVNNNPVNGSRIESNRNPITLLKVILLALVDSVNPCALAILLMMLLAITTYHLNDKKKVLMAGLAFTSSVFFMYFIYGLFLIRLFKFLLPIKVFIHSIVAVLAIILAILEIKDYINYKPGTLGTEMPMGLRPKVKKIISKITSPKGAFFVGLFVTIFLLPCTIGPYVILGEMLSIISILKTIPLLLLYNLIFILPMLIITFIIYLGVKKIEDISKWKERNIRILHLIAGLIILFLGLGMLFGFF